jgi:hypothetical protein
MAHGSFTPLTLVAGTTARAEDIDAEMTSIAAALPLTNTFTGTGTGAAQTVSHGLGATPDIIIIMYAGNFGSPPTHPIYYYNVTSSQVTIVADNAYSWVAIAIKQGA